MHRYLWGSVEKWCLHNVIKSLSIIISVIAVLSPMLLRVTKMLRSLSVEDQSVLYVVEIIRNDSLYYSIIFASIVLSIWLNRLIARIITGSITCLLVCLYVFDIVVYQNFSMRLYWYDVVVYATDIDTYKSSLLGLSLGKTILLSISGLVFILFSKKLLHFLKNRFASQKRQLLIAYIAASIVMAVIGMLPAKSADNYDAFKSQSIVSININTTSGHKYTDDYVRWLARNKNDDRYYVKGDNRKPNILLIILESFSNYQSKLFSGINDWTPRMDSIAKDNIYFTRYHANGYITNHGLTSLLTGAWPIPGYSLYDNTVLNYKNGDTSLPSYLNNKGYYSYFLTSGDLSFTKKGEWLSRIKYNHIEGHDIGDYEGVNRFIFNSVPDEYLYKRAYKLIQSNRCSPYFMTIENVSSHWPYIDPKTGRKSLELAIRYSDQELGAFYQKLISDHLLDNTVVIIVGDHRSPTRVSREEFLKYGEESLSLVPAIIIDNTRMPERIDSLAQQKDMLISIKQLTSDKVKVNSEDGLYLTPIIKEPKYILHTRGDWRDNLNIIVREGNAVVKLDGDNTRIIRGRIAEPDAVIMSLNMHRLEKVGYIDKPYD